MSEPDAPPAGGAGLTGVGLTGVGLTGVGLGAGFAVGFALADLLGVGVVDALVGAAVVEGAALDEPPPEVFALEATAGDTAALETATLETAGIADDAAPLALASVLDGVPSGAA
ncbi:MAG TPA: hypothetical protein VN683_09285 [Acidothermaceae bacterium]|nr:hypothetical protein [Acidothermaceae bacterium]